MHCRPEARLTSRSAEMPPWRTATRFASSARPPRRGTPMRLISHSSVDAAMRQHAGAHLLAQRFQLGRGGAAGVEQEVAVLLADLRARRASGRGSRRRRSAPRPCAPGGFLKVEPPVRARTGCVASRAARISAMRAAIAAASPGRGAQAGADHDGALPAARRGGRRSGARRRAGARTPRGRGDLRPVQHVRRSRRRRRRRSSPPRRRCCPGCRTRNSSPARPAAAACSATVDVERRGAGDHAVAPPTATPPKAPPSRTHHARARRRRG